VPATQLEQAPAPAAVLNKPALQLEQVDAPVAAWKVPATHGVHADTFDDAENVPARQLTQAAAPLYWPGVQTTGVHALEPATAVENVAHGVHEVAPATA